MAGHSKWANRVHRKTRQDVKRSKMFSKFSRALMVAAREGGSNPDDNPTLRSLMDQASAADMPKDNIEYAIKRGTGELEGVEFESVRYEGYGPGGVAMLVECVTDNNQRSVAEIRNIMSKRDGKMSGAGSVTWMFELKGVITIPRAEAEYDDVFLAGAEAGAEDIVDDDEEYWEIRTAMEDFHKVRNALKDAGIAIERAELSMIPTSTVKVPDEYVGQLLRLLEDLDDHDDVQHVYSNFEISDEALEAYEVAGN
ncbi:MAG: YebC/PmpR family DNA-binding transcriptional regulator [candidate division WS1 bacterium]|nr:YebC/PmpR family DNA-binding transcriptional regulator [candidate division WS1 bacterium]